MYQADDPTFVANLKTHLATESAPKLAARIADRIGYLPDGSLIRKMSAGRVPTSALVKPICDVLGWPLPPPANSPDSMMSLLEELKRDSPPDYEHVQRLVLNRVEAVREEAKLKPGKS